MVEILSWVKPHLHNGEREALTAMLQAMMAGEHAMNPLYRGVRLAGVGPVFPKWSVSTRGKAAASRYSKVYLVTASGSTVARMKGDSCFKG